MGSEETQTAIAAKIAAAENEIKALFSKAQTALSKMDGLQGSVRPVTSHLNDQLTETRRRLHEKKLVIVFVGATSSGKSTLINTLIRQRLLRAATQHCTPCSVSVETLPDIKDPFFTKGRFSHDSHKFNISTLADTTDAQHSSHSTEPIFVYLPRQRANNVLKIEKMRLVDTPGVFESSFQNNVDLEGDAFVFLVDFDSDSSWRKLTEIFTESTKHVNKAVFIVFNACDKEQDKERFDKGRRVKLKKATTFLLDNRVYQSEEAADNAVFFLSALAAETQRCHDASLRGLRTAIARIVNSKNRGANGFHKMVVCGNSDAGKTTLCNDLVGLEVFPADETETTCFMSVQATKSLTIPMADYQKKERLSQEPAEMNSLAQTILSFADQRQTDIHSSHIVEIVVPKSQLPVDSILHSKVAVVDSAPLEEINTHGSIGNTECPTPSILAVVVRGDVNPRQMKREIESSLRFCCISKSSQVDVFLIVTRWREGRDEEAETQIARMMEAICQRLELATPHIFFLERENRTEEYGGVFDVFETQLLEAAHDKFAETKLRRIQSSAQKLRADIDQTVQQGVTKLQEMIQVFQQLTDTLQMKDETLVAKRSTRAERFLKTKPDLPDDNSQMENFFDDFLTFYRDDLTSDIQYLIQKALENLHPVDKKSREEMEAFLKEKTEVFKSHLDWKSESDKPDAFGLKETLAKFLEFIPSTIHEATEKEIKEMKGILANLQNVLLPALDDEITTTERKIDSLEKQKDEKDKELSEKRQAINDKRKDLEDIRQTIQDIDQAIARKDVDIKASAILIGNMCNKLSEMRREFVKDQAMHAGIAGAALILIAIPIPGTEVVGAVVASVSTGIQLFKFCRSRKAIKAYEAVVENLWQEALRLGNEAKANELQKIVESCKIDEIESDIRTATQERDEREKEIMTCTTETNKLTSDLQAKTAERDEKKTKIKEIQESLPAMKVKFLQQKKQWEAMTRKYSTNLLAGFEKMSDIIFYRILQQLCDAVQLYTSTHITELEDERDALEAIRRQLMDAS